MTRTVAVVIHPGFQVLDATGPATAFEIAERFCPGSYRLRWLAPEAGEVVSSSQVRVRAESLDDGPFDTILVSGGEIVRSPSAVWELIGWLTQVRARRIASVCSGAFLLAEAGLLDGRRATTHWGACDSFRRRYPRVQLDAECIFVRDGNIWTSAGISAGIDLALALIEDDLGEALTRRTAQQLVVHHRRPGGQSQFSALVALGGRSGRFAELIQWVRAHLSEPLTVECLAERAAMSPRHFARCFMAETGVTPAKAVERLRLEVARNAVETGYASFERIAEEAGFRDPGRMRRAFLRAFELPPQVLRRSARHQRG
ncbi:GlxA family transcriptional regulator [Alloalcanivorax xenomutans]|jgi:transcriptional regulator GlxA family with amidase domain|uniref:GlxA family transcriptional regulator n=1 Tax=Alloalcanivorax xenomutans TaxID=1094342 RepID=UPI000E259510|nr:GlxA family transcriptional regulator [Alloalcanivorax xenomutans]